MAYRTVTSAGRGERALAAYKDFQGRIAMSNACELASKPPLLSWGTAQDLSYLVIPYAYVTSCVSGRDEHELGDDSPTNIRQDERSSAHIGDRRHLPCSVRYYSVVYSAHPNQP